MSRFSTFGGCSEWLNGTMRLNEHFGCQLTTSASGRTVVPSENGAFMNALDSIWEISVYSYENIQVPHRQELTPGIPCIVTDPLFVTALTFTSVQRIACVHVWILQ